MAALVPFNSLAIEPPADNTEPPPALVDENERPPRENRVSEAEQDIPFIGLATAVVPDMVADHLGLEAGSGVIIRTVFPGSPAEKSGLAINDVIVTIGETSVGDPEALSSSIRAHKPGDRIEIGLIHRGKPGKTEVTLAARPAGQISGMGRDSMPEGLPKAHADRLRGLIERNLGSFGGGSGDVGLP